MSVRSVIARTLIALLAVTAVGTAVDQALADQGASNLPGVFSEAGEGIAGG